MHSISVFIILALTLSCTFALDVTLNQHWKLWKDTNNKRYSDTEEHVRRAIWESNLKKVQEHNRQADLGVHTYWLGMNKYADMTTDEFVKVMNGYNATIRREGSNRHDTFIYDPNVELPDTVDWRTKGCVTDIKIQGACASDWAFTAVSTIETEYCIKHDKLIALSGEEVLDCSKTGCNGGLADEAFDEIKKLGGLESEASYPSGGGSKGPCRFDPKKVVVKITGHVNLPSQNEDALQQAVATIGAIAVAIDANHVSFQLYSGGIYNEPQCSSTRLDHAVTVVGYGTDSGTPYWLVRNSWSPNWGEKGYIRMSRNKNNQCGIATAASYPTL